MWLMNNYIISKFTFKIFQRKLENQTLICDIVQLANNYLINNFLIKTASPQRMNGFFGGTVRWNIPAMRQ